MRELKLTVPALIDDMDGSAETAYRGWPARLVIVDVDGRVAWLTRTGPNGADLQGADGALDKVLKGRREGR